LIDAHARRKRQIDRRDLGRNRAIERDDVHVHPVGLRRRERALPPAAVEVGVREEIDRAPLVGRADVEREAQCALEIGVVSRDLVAESLGGADPRVERGDFFGLVARRGEKARARRVEFRERSPVAQLVANRGFERV
jgi:hypothetical protein